MQSIINLLKNDNLKLIKIFNYKSKGAKNCLQF